MKRAIGNMSQEPRFSPSHGVCPFSCVIFMCLFTQLCVMCGFWRFSLVLSPMGFPGGSMVKNLPANAGDAGSIPGSGRSPGEGKGYPLQDSCLKNPMGRGAWWLQSMRSQRVGHHWDTEHPHTLPARNRTEDQRGCGEKWL